MSCFNMVGNTWLVMEHTQQSGTLKHTAHGTLEHTGAHWSTLKHIEAHWITLSSQAQVQWSTLGHTGAHWSTLGGEAEAHWSTLMQLHIGAHWSTPSSEAESHSLKSSLHSTSSNSTYTHSLAPLQVQIQSKLSSGVVSFAKVFGRDKKGLGGVKKWPIWRHRRGGTTDRLLTGGTKRMKVPPSSPPAPPLLPPFPPPCSAHRESTGTGV